MRHQSYITKKTIFSWDFEYCSDVWETFPLRVFLSFKAVPVALSVPVPLQFSSDPATTAANFGQETYAPSLFILFSPAVLYAVTFESSGRPHRTAEVQEQRDLAILNNILSLLVDQDILQPTTVVHAYTDSTQATLMLASQRLLLPKLHNT